MIKSSLILFCVLLCSFHKIAAQEFRYKADLGEVKQTGFYRIDLNSDVRAKAKLQLEDIRIWDGKNYVPFVIRQASPSISPSLAECPIIEHTRDTAGNTLLTIENITGRSIDHLQLIIKNNVVFRGADLTGSNDRQQWYAIEENVPLESDESRTGTEFVQHLYFPMVDYKFIRLVIYNKKKAALNIVKVLETHYGPQALASSIIENPPLVFNQHDSSNGNSYVTITQKEEYPVGTIIIFESSTKFFDRSGTLYFMDDTTLSGAYGGVPVSVHSGAIFGGSNGQTAYSITKLATPLKGRRFLLVIQNGDNPPLKVDNIQTLHDRSMLYAYLEKDKKYQVLFGNRDARSPSYDLESFSDSIPSSAPQLSYSIIQQVNTTPGATDKKRSTTLLWIVIIAAITTLGFFAVKLVREMNSKT